MCTVTYFPKDKSFIFTSNRDEIATRNAERIVTNAPLIYPLDEGRKGTWFLVRRETFVRCLLNGAFEKHKHLPPYSKSRGIMLLESDDYPTLRAFSEAYDFRGIEPFTLVEVHFEAEKPSLSELRWDGIQTHYTALPADKQRIWSSATLYNEDSQTVRQYWFDDFFAKNDPTSDSIMEFHQSRPSDNDFINFLMKRPNGPETISITQFRPSETPVLVHHNLKSQTTNNIQ